MFLVSRAYLGNPQERQALLDMVNEKLQIEQPTLPPFQMEDLEGAMSAKGVDLTAIFRLEIDLGDLNFKRVTATLIRKEKGAKPLVNIGTMEFKKLR